MATDQHSSSKTCEHGLRLLLREKERLCALEYLNRFVAPRRIERVNRRGAHLYLVFDSGEKLECCCEGCGESHGDDEAFSHDIREMTLGRRALRFRLDRETGHLVVWFARGDHLHLHRNSLVRFRPATSRRGWRGHSLRSLHATGRKAGGENGS